MWRLIVYKLLFSWETHQQASFLVLCSSSRWHSSSGAIHWLLGRVEEATALPLLRSPVCLLYLLAQRHYSSDSQSSWCDYWSNSNSPPMVSYLLLADHFSNQERKTCAQPINTRVRKRVLTEKKLSIKKERLVHWYAAFPTLAVRHGSKTNSHILLFGVILCFL